MGSLKRAMFVVMGLLGACSVDDRVVGVRDESGAFGDAGSGQGGAPPALIVPVGGAAGQGVVPMANGGPPPFDGADAGQFGSAAMGESSPSAPAGGTGGSAAGISGECVAGATGCSGGGVALNPVAGRVTAESNGLGVDGEFYVASDGGTGGPSIVTSSFAGSDVCVEGVAGPVGLDSQGMPDYVGHWGVVVGLNLAQQGTARGPWYTSAAEGTVVGFSFVLTGPAIPATLRFSADSPDESMQYCALANAQSGVARAISLAELATECWLPGAGTPAPPAGPFGNVEWVIPATTDAPVPFEFCISELQGIVR